MGHYAETHDDCERVHDRWQQQVGFRAEHDPAVVCTRSVGSRRPLVCGKGPKEKMAAARLGCRAWLDHTGAWRGLAAQALKTGMSAKYWITTRNDA